MMLNYGFIIFRTFVREVTRRVKAKSSRVTETRERPPTTHYYYYKTTVVTTVTIATVNATTITTKLLL